MYPFIRPLLFLLDPEWAHHSVMAGLSYIPKSWFKAPLQQPKQVMGLTFPNAIGLAAGFDKSGAHVDALAKLGFGYIEVGTVTPQPQAGNPKPRLFRLPAAKALINRMGMNNPGVECVLQNLQKREWQGILGINIGKGRETPLTHASKDYLFCLEKVYPHASYVTVNISSPNTKDLRQLQQTAYFEDLMRDLRQTQLRLAEQYKRHVPLVIKISPDETDETLKLMTDVILQQQIEGIIATNTTTSRAQIQNLRYGTEEGGMSGVPLFSRSTACLKLIKSLVGHSVALIAVGGIDSETAAQEKYAAGADLLQIYTGLIYEGYALIPRLASTISI